jgi:hypothetical protein
VDWEHERLQELTMAYGSVFPSFLLSYQIRTFGRVCVSYRCVYVLCVRAYAQPPPQPSHPTNPNTPKPNPPKYPQKNRRPLAELVVAKKREVERYCPSGAYPTPVLFLRHENRELPLPEAILRCLDALLQATGRGHGASHSSSASAAAAAASSSSSRPPSRSGGMTTLLPPHPVIHHSGPHAFLQVDPALRDALPYLTRCSLAQQPHHPHHPQGGQGAGGGVSHDDHYHHHHEGGGGSGNAAAVMGPVPDSVGHIFVRWLRVAKEVGEETGWRFFRLANAALATLPLRPSDRRGPCQSEVCVGGCGEAWGWGVECEGGKRVVS